MVIVLLIIAIVFSVVSIVMMSLSSDTFIPAGAGQRTSAPSGGGISLTILPSLVLGALL